MTNLFELTQSPIFNEKGCECGNIHKIDFCVEIDLDLVKVCREIVPKGGLVFILAGESIPYNFTDELHQNLLNSGFEVVRFEPEVESVQTFSLPDGCNLILGIGDSALIERCKLLSASFDTKLVAVPTRFDIAKVGLGVSEIDYGGTVLSRPSRKPDKIVLLSNLFANLNSQEFADIFGEFCSFSLAFCDYAYRETKNGGWCDQILKSATTLFWEILECSPNKSQEKIKEILPKIVQINILLGVIGIESGAEQLSSCLARFFAKKGRKGSSKGERLIMSAYLLSVTYANFLSERRKYFVPDTNLGLDKAKRLFGMSEKECVENGKSFHSQTFDYDDFVVGSCFSELHAVAVDIGKILAKSFSIYRKLRQDFGYGIKERISVSEMLDIISGSVFCNRWDTLFTFIKERGVLEFKTTKI